MCHYKYDEWLEKVEIGIHPPQLSPHPGFWVASGESFGTMPLHFIQTLSMYQASRMMRIFSPMLRLLSNIYLTIHHTNEERLEGLRCCEMSESVCTRSMLVWNIGAWYRNFHHLRLKSQDVVTVVEDEFQSPPSPTIHYIYNDTLEGLGCWMLWIAYISQYTHNLGSKSKYGPSQICTLSELENRLWWPFQRADIPISTMSNLSSY